MLSWQWPWFILLLPLPWLLRLLLKPQTRKVQTLRVPFYQELLSTNESAPLGKPRWPLLLASVA